jgi:hypothetical protein
MAMMGRPADGRTSAHDLRCECGRLMARLTKAGVELKCQRCKRIVVLPPPPDDGRWIPVPRG